MCFYPHEIVENIINLTFIRFYISLALKRIENIVNWYIKFEETSLLILRITNKINSMQPINKLNKYILLLALLPVLSACDQVQKAEAQKPSPLQQKQELLVEKTIINGTDTNQIELVNSHQLFSEGWDTLAQPLFWKQIICLSPDSCIVNIARSRTPLVRTNYKEWLKQSESEKTVFKSQLKEDLCIDYSSELYVTNGKNEFYEHRKSIPTIAKAVSYFKEYGVDPWYAQTILLIESPGKHLAKSYVGAAGPFQIMRSVALMYGLKVNKYVDERSDLKRASYGASRLISTVCIPRVKNMLNSRNIAYSETDIWFRLLVLHAYHAGAGNLACAINQINPAEGGQSLLKTLWKTECGGFKNESQNYSQIALAAIMNFENIIHIDGDSIFMIQGDKALANTIRNSQEKENGYLLSLMMYERDLADGTINYAYFAEKVTELKKEITKTNPNSTSIYPSNEDQLVRLSDELLKKRKMEDVIQLLRLNMDLFPESFTTAEHLSKAYKMSGNAGMAQKYMTKSNELSR